MAPPALTSRATRVALPAGRPGVLGVAAAVTGGGVFAWGAAHRLLWAWPWRCVWFGAHACGADRAVRRQRGRARHLRGGARPEPRGAELAIRGRRRGLPVPGPAPCAGSSPRTARVRVADVLVEACLVGTAVGIVLLVAVNTRRDDTLTTVWGDAVGAFPAPAGRPRRGAPRDRCAEPLEPRGPGEAPGFWHVGLVSLLLAHLWQSLLGTHGRPAGSVASVLALVGLVALARRRRAPGGPKRSRSSPSSSPSSSRRPMPRSSSSRCSPLPSCWWCRPPARSPLSATVATGATVSGVILAVYLHRPPSRPCRHRAPGHPRRSPGCPTASVDRLVGPQRAADARRTARSGGPLP